MSFSAVLASFWSSERNSQQQRAESQDDQHVIVKMPKEPREYIKVEMPEEPSNHVAVDISPDHVIDYGLEEDNPSVVVDMSDIESYTTRAQYFRVFSAL